MKIFLVKPYNITDHIQPSLGLGYLAHNLRTYHNVSLIDCLKNGIQNPALAEKIKNEKPDIVGIQCYSSDIDVVYDLVERIKSLNPNIITVLGGPHPSLVPVETMTYFGALIDFCFAGEAEVGLPKLLDRLEKKDKWYRDIESLVWRDSIQVVVNKPLFVDNLDELGEPSWDKIKPETYPECQHGVFYRKFPIAPLSTTRGCPFRCRFCGAPQLSGKKVRHHSIEYLVKQITYLHKVRGIKEFDIIDDNFTVDINFAKRFLKAVIELRFDITFATPNGVHLQCLDDELLVLMKSCGFYLLSVAVESASNRILKLMEKAETIEKIDEKINLIKKHGFEIAAFVILGYPTETIQEMEQTIRYTLKIPAKRVNYFSFIPIPGTKIFQELIDSGEIKNKADFYKPFMSTPYAPRPVTVKELEHIKKRAFLRFYLRPKILVSFLLDIRSFAQVKYIVKRFYHWVIK